MPQDQTIKYDDFEQSCIESGIEIIVPEEEADLPEGIGASQYKPRLTAPSSSNPYYLKHGRGGHNRCIVISGNSCLPNCVGYAHGRVLEIGGAAGNPLLPTCNAEDWLATAKKNGFQTSDRPKLGAVIVWRSGNLWNGADGCGHVGVVEQINADGTITVGQSNYGGTRFFLTKHKAPYNITGQTFIGFIDNPYVKPGWIKDDRGWWYQRTDGTYPKNEWMKVNDVWYHFDASGYMQTGWIKDDGKWYYLESNGAMAAKKWIKYKEKWYYLQSDGAMVENAWLKYKDEWYYLGKDGAMLTAEQTVPVFFEPDGKFSGSPKKNGGQIV